MQYAFHQRTDSALVSAQSMIQDYHDNTMWQIITESKMRDRRHNLAEMLPIFLAMLQFGEVSITALPTSQLGVVDVNGELLFRLFAGRPRGLH